METIINETKSDLLLHYYIKAQEYVRQYRKGNVTLIFLLFLTVALPTAYFIICNEKLLSKETRWESLVWLIISFAVPWILGYVYIQYTDNKMFKALNIPSNKYYTQKESYRKCKIQQINKYYNYLLDDKLLINSKVRNIDFINLYISSLQREITIRNEQLNAVGNPFLKSTFTQIIIGVTSGFLVYLFKLNIAIGLIVVLSIAIAMGIIVILVMLYRIISNQRGAQREIITYKHIIYYLEVIKEQILFEQILAEAENEEKNKLQETSNKNKTTNTLIDSIAKFFSKYIRGLLKQ